jgi:hypothetical protein
MSNVKSKKNLFLNIAFIITGVAILLFLYVAPEETTSKLPHDEIHEPFHAIKSKKEAGKNCIQCHDEDKSSPLPETHPPKYRCLFCHKR